MLISACSMCGGSRVCTPAVSGMSRPCPVCRRESYPARPDPMAAPHVDVSVPAFGGSVRLRSASGGLESLWISLHDEAGREVSFDQATGRWCPAPVRLTPSDARTLSDLLRRYADTHRETEE